MENRHTNSWGRGDYSATSKRASAGQQGHGFFARIPLLARGREFYRRRNRRQRFEGFVRACGELFAKVPLQAGDVVFVPTVSPFDLQGLASYLQSTPHTTLATWHLQFQFDLLDPPTKARSGQPRLASLRRQCQDAQQLIPHHDISWYTTTSRLATQYQQLGIGKVRELPYPVNPGLHARRRLSSRSRPLRITCAGGMRREKGSHELAAVIRELWLPYLVSRRGQIQIQATRRQFRRLLSRVKDLWNRDVARRAGKPDDQACLVRIEQPLPMDAYEHLIHETDIGLLLYNRDSYYARCSGVLVEMLAAGVPVIVPAAGWLADQLAEPNFLYHDQLQRDAELVGRERLRTTARQQMGPHGPTRTMTAQVAVPPHVTGIITRFRHNRNSPDSYVSLHTEFRDDTGSLLDTRCSTVGVRAGGEPASTLAPVCGWTSKVFLTWRNVYDDALPDVQDVEVCFLGVDPQRRHPYPTGAVGLTASDSDQFPRLLSEIIEHYDHYRKTAAAFSSQWMTEHSPGNVLRTILGRYENSECKAITTDAA